jgi:hypothetical protein
VTGPQAGVLTVARRFCGPPSSGNGGYVAGRLAAYLDPERAVAVTLRKPPPLDRRLRVETTTTDGTRTDTEDGAVRLFSGDDLVAEATYGEFAHPVAPAVPVERALEAEPLFAGLRGHPFPGCFVCGPSRPAHDGLALQPGRTGPGRTACTWTPDPSLAAEATPPDVAARFVWSALDCPGGWTSDLEARPLVLGRMTARVDRPVSVGETYVVVGILHGTDRRKTFTGSALYDAGGSLLARAEHVWIAVDPSQL